MSRERTHPSRPLGLGDLPEQLVIGHGPQLALQAVCVPRQRHSSLDGRVEPHQSSELPGSCHHDCRLSHIAGKPKSLHKLLQDVLAGNG
jgi:hypothetical protein